MQLHVSHCIIISHYMYEDTCRERKSLKMKNHTLFNGRITFILQSYFTMNQTHCSGAYIFKADETQNDSNTFSHSLHGIVVRYFYFCVVFSSKSYKSDSVHHQ